MDGPEYNLLTEKWIRVMREDCHIDELSLIDVLVRAHEYKGLAGEIPTQNAAMLRLLLAVLHAVFERVDVDGNRNALKTPDDAIDRWAELWQNRRFPEKPIRAYLEVQRENFWLFHPTRPFFQRPNAVKGTEYEAAKLNGSLSESSNKIRLFPVCTGENKKQLLFSEAARWLLYVNAFDDTSSKPTKAGKADHGGKLPSPGVGWLGKIGFVCFEGENLFETLMLNFVLLDQDAELWSSSIPAWELEHPSDQEREQIPIPHDQAALLTLQSRRLILDRNKDKVIGYHLLGGDFFDRENSFSEQMTVWGSVKDKKGNETGLQQPKRHDRARQMWRDFGLYAEVTYAAATNKNSIPGIVRWNALLSNNGILPNDRLMRLSIASVQYGDKDFFVSDTFDDSLNVHLGLLSDLGATYRALIMEEIGRCDRIAGCIGTLANDLFFAAGGDTEKKILPSASAKEKYYDAIDILFRKWLASLKTEDTDRDEHIKQWRQTAIGTADRLAEKMVRAAGPAAFVGKTIKRKETDEKKYYSSSMAMQRFKMNMKRV